MLWPVAYLLLDLIGDGKLVIRHPVQRTVHLLVHVAEFRQHCLALQRLESVRASVSSGRTWQEHAKVQIATEKGGERSNQEDLAAVVAGAEEPARDGERAAEQGEPAVGIVGEARRGVAELLQEWEDELQPAQEAGALLPLRAAELGEGSRRVDSDEELLDEVLVVHLPLRRRLRVVRRRRRHRRWRHAA
jgi:hypothetical protein